MLTRLIQGEAGGEQLSEAELYQNCIFILNAGHETTTNLIGNGLVALPAGTRITLCIGAANRDPEVHADPARLDIRRSPNRHLAFGFGAHQCVGMSLARLEGRVAIGRFLQRFPGDALAGAPVRGGRVRFRGFLRVPLQFGSGSGSDESLAGA